MQGVTTALVSFLLVCVVFPHLVKNRPQYYAAFFVVCLIIVMDALGMMLQSHSAFVVFVYVICAFLQVLAMVLLFLSAGGITWRQLSGDMARAFEVIRRGEEEKEVIIPIGGQMPRQHARPTAADLDDYQPGRITIDPPARPPSQADASAEKVESSGDSSPQS
jgi:hypothetical protein